MAISTVNDPVARACEAVQSRSDSATTIDLSGGKSHFCDDSDMSQLADAWRSAADDPTHVTSIDLSINRIGDEGALALAKAIASRPHGLTNFELDGNELSGSGIVAVAGELLTENSSITRVDLSSNKKMSADDVQAFVSHARRCSALRSVVLRANGVDDDGMNHICEWLAAPDCGLTSLHVSGNDMTEAAVAGIADAIRANTSLTDLNLSNSMAHIADMEPIVEAVSVNESLLVLPLTFDGKKRAEPAVAAALCRNKNAVKARGEYIAQLKAAHEREIAALKRDYEARIAELETGSPKRDGAQDGPAEPAPDGPAEGSNVGAEPADAATTDSAGETKPADSEATAPPPGGDAAGSTEEAASAAEPAPAGTTSDTAQPTEAPGETDAGDAQPQNDS